MNIHLIDQTNIKGEALTYLLEQEGYKVKYMHELNHINRSRLKEHLFFIIDADYLEKNYKSRNLDLRFKPNRTLILGQLSQLYWMKFFSLSQTGFICKNTEVTYLMTILKEKNKMKLMIDDKIKNFLNKTRFSQQNILFQGNIKSPLTKTETKIIREIGIGSTTRHIAKKWHKSEHTINNHRKNILNKITFNGKYALYSFCTRYLEAVKTIIYLNSQINNIRGLLKYDYR